MNSPVGKGRKSTDENTSDNNSPFHHLVTENQDTTFTQRTPNMESQLQRSFGMLYRLPPELRIMVYSNLVLDGSVAIARVCKAVNEEVRDVITEKGIYKIKVGEFYHELNPEITYPGKNISILVDKVHLWISRCCPPQLPNKIARWKTKNVCRVTIPLLSCPDESVLPRFTLHLLRLFTGFKELIVRLVLDNRMVPVYTRRKFKIFDFNKVLPDTYEVLNSNLRDTLGDGKLVKDAGSQEIMIFYPQANFTEDKSEGKGL